MPGPTPVFAPTRIQRVAVLPGLLFPNTLYIVEPGGSDYQLILTDAAGAPTPLTADTVSTVVFTTDATDPPAISIAVAQALVVQVLSPTHVKVWYAYGTPATAFFLLVDAGGTPASAGNLALAYYLGG